MKYYANFSANNGTSFAKPIEGNNKAKLIKDIREIAEGERHYGSRCSWSVFYVDTDTFKETVPILVASGGMTENGRRYRDIIL